MSAVRPRRSWWLGLPVACLLAISATGCDTVALISFSEREFQAIDSSGFTATSGSCGAIEDGRATLRFVLMADDNTPIRPDEVVGGAPISLTPESLSFSETGIFELPDKPCESGECRLDGMSCDTNASVPDSAQNRRCQREAGISLDGPIQFESDTTKPQLFGVIYENAGSLGGWLPSEVGGLYPDWDGDGTAEGSDDPNVIPNRASDPTSTRQAALAIMISNWKQARSNAADEQRSTSFGLWEAKGTSQNQVVSLVEGLSPTGSAWTTSPDIAESSRNEFSQITGTRANVFMAIEKVLDDAYAPSEFDNHEKTLVVFVDGPDDLRYPTFTAESVIEKATENGVRMFIVHLDASQVPTTQAGTPVHRDHFRYWSERIDGSPIQTPCSDDTECKNFETCRVPLAYASSLGASVEPEFDPMGDTYCMPERDPDNGRLGPIDEYARIACATDGGYIYVKEGSGLRPRMDWLPFSMDGLWKVDTVVDVLQNLNVPSGEGYRFQTTMGVTLGGSARNYNFSQVGEPISNDDGADTRAVLFN